MKTDIVGLIYTSERTDRLDELTRVRDVAALPMLGRYRLIDFLLSDMVNSGIKNVGIILQKNYQSLLDQLGSGRDWDLHGNRSGMTLLPPFVVNNDVGKYTGLLQALKCNLSFLRRSKEKYIAVADCNSLYSIRFDGLLEYHLQHNFDITLVYTKHKKAVRHGSGRYLDIDENCNVKQLEFDPTLPRFENTYIGVFIIRRDLLINLVERSISIGFQHFVRDMIKHAIDDQAYKVGAFELSSNVWVIDSVPAYYQANMDSLSPTVQEMLFSTERPIWTKLKNEIPSKYTKDSNVKNSLIADGCVIEGKVEDSIIFRGVTIKKGSSIKSSIVMQGSYIAQNCEIENCILEKQTNIREGKRLISAQNYPIVIAKNVTI